MRPFLADEIKGDFRDGRTQQEGGGKLRVKKEPSSSGEKVLEMLLAQQSL
jgi:hypothetical protein